MWRNDWNSGYACCRASGRAWGGEDAVVLGFQNRKPLLQRGERAAVSRTRPRYGVMVLRFVIALLRLGEARGLDVAELAAFPRVAFL